MISTDPGATAVTIPSLETVAIAEEAVLHVIARPFRMLAVASYVIAVA